MEKNKIHSYKELIVWQKAMDLVVAIYDLTSDFPKEEQYSLTFQIKRSSISIPSNIAEGRKRGTRKDYRHFFVIAYSSGAELETQIEIAKRLKLSKKLDFHAVDGLLLEVMKMLNKMLSSLRS